MRDREAELGETSDLVVRGMWFLPEKPEQRVAGTLTLPRGEMATLHLFGSLLGDEWEPKSHVLLGDIFDAPTRWRRPRITVCEAFLSSHTDRSAGLPRIETWSGHDFLLGSWQAEPNVKKYSRFDVETDRLGEWAISRTRKVQRSPIHQEDEHTASVHVPTPIEWGIPGGRVRLRWYPSSSWDDHVATARVTPVLEFELDAGVSLEDAWRDIVTPVLQLMVLITGRGDRVRRLRVYSDDELFDDASHNYLEGCRAEWQPTSWFKPLVIERTLWIDHMLSLEEAAERREFFNDWFGMARKHRMAFLQYFAEKMGDSKYLEDGFTRAVRAIEVWHRTEFGGTRLPSDVFRAGLRDAKAALGREMWAVISVAAKNANQPSLRSRLDDTVAKSGNSFSEVAKEFPELTARVVATRNQLTHEGTVGERLTYHEVWLAQRILESAFGSVLLQELGLSETQVAERFQRNRDWKWIRSEVAKLRRSSADDLLDGERA